MTNSGKIVGVVVALALGATACNNDDLTAINKNPNSPTTAPSGPVFTQAVRLSVTRWLGIAYDQRSTELVAQHLAEVQYPQSDSYQRLQANSTSATFDGAYAQELEDFTQVMRRGLGLHEPGLYGPSMVMRTWGFSYLTDTWGDIPYFSALQGDSASANITPKYDAQKDIYADFFKLLDKAADDLAAAPTGVQSLGSADPIYAGNFLKWERFANSLRARLAMRIVNVDATTAKNEFLAAMANPGGLMASNADNAVFKWPGDGVYNNPWSTNFQDRDDHRLSDRFVTILKNNADPRISVWGQRAEQDTVGSNKIVKYCTTAVPCYAGLQNALTQADATAHVPYTSRPGLIFYPAVTTYSSISGTGASYPSYLLTYAEVSFLKAEAAERGWITGSAQQFYEDGIRASMAQWGVTNSALVDAYILTPGVAYTPGVAGQKQIAQQKWLHLFADGGQAWAEWRRTCQPASVKPGPEAITSEVPRRFQYSVTETVTNASAVSAAIAQQGADDFLTRMYWDKNPTAAPTYETNCGKR
jgi:hypothetical protein